MDEKSMKRRSDDSLPSNFVWDADNEFYYGPMVCQKLHYKTAAILVGFMEILVVGLATFSFICERRSSSLCSHEE